MSVGRQKIRDHRGFLLTELLISLLTFIVITAAILTTLKLSAEKITSFLDYRKATLRIAKAAALLKAPVFYCGFGMPLSSSVYKRAFGSQKFDPFRWEGPISACKGPNSFANSELRIAYAMPGTPRLSLRTVSEYSESLVRLDKFPPLGSIGESFAGCAFDIRNWVIFPSSFPPALPLRITAASGKTLSVKNNFDSSFSISKGDRIYHFRAMKIYCLNDRLYTKDFRSSGDQPRIEGIRDMRFDVDIGKRTITVYLLVRGDHLYEKNMPIKNSDLWPDEYIGPWISKGSKYQQFAAKRVWRLPNCISEEITDLEKTSIREHF